MFKVSPVSLQTFIDTPNCVLEDRVQYSTVHIPNVFCDGKGKGKGKAVPLQAWTGPEGSRRLRLPDFKTIGT